MAQTKEKREPMNAVKLRVREAALTLREFTLDQLVKATGFKRLSVQTELTRMREDRYLTSEALPGPHPRPGKPPLIYRLTPDRERLEELITEVRPFRPKFTEPARPSGRNYTVARQFLDRVAGEEYQDEEGKDVLLENVAEALELAWAEEGETETIPDAFIKYEWARLYFWRGEYDAAEPLFVETRAAFAGSEEYADEVAKVEHHLASITMARESEGQADSPEETVEAVLRAIASVSPSSRAEFPLLGQFEHALQKFTRFGSAHWQVLTVAAERIANMSCLGGRPRFSGRRLPFRDIRPPQRLRRRDLAAFGLDAAAHRSRECRRIEDLHFDMAIRGPVGIFSTPPPFHTPFRGLLEEKRRLSSIQREAVVEF